MNARPIERVVIAGGGIVAWSAAAALKRKLPRLAVTVLASEPPADALAERIPATLPSILGFHADLGLRDEDTIVRARSALRLGTEFVAWNHGLAPYVHAYAPHGRPLGTTSFHLHWVRLARDGAPPPFDAFSPAAALARAGRLAPPGAEPEGLEHGLVLDLPLHSAMMRAYALHLGATARETGLADVRLRADGFVGSLRLDDGSELGGDLFVDATGPAALLRSRLDPAFEDWSPWLPCDRVLLGESPAQPEPPLLDRAEALPAGWRWRSGGVERTAHGLAYASGALSDEAAARLLAEGGARAAGAPVALRQGRRPRPWLRNCVAIGDAAVAVEPLEWTGLHLAHSAIDRLVAMMPDRDCAAVELAEYNRQSEAEANRVRDFLALHYLASARPEPFWRDAAAARPPASLAHTLSLFRERGRLPFHEEETFSRDSWLAVLLGQGVIPRRVDPLALSVPREEAVRRIEDLGASLAAAGPGLATHGEYLTHLTRQVRR